MPTLDHHRASVLVLVASSWCAPAAVSACDGETPTRAVVANAYSDLPDRAGPSTEIVVYKAWWGTTLFADPVIPGSTSDELRTVPAEATAYALLAPGWDPASATAPTTLIPVRSIAKLAVSRGEVLQITVSDATFAGRCSAGQPLSREDAAFITERIFPGEFTDRIYDAQTCTTTAAETGDAGADGDQDP
jgi:hypothetical protein